MLQIKTTGVQVYESLTAAAPFYCCSQVIRSIWNFIREDICTIFSSANKVHIDVLNIDFYVAMYVTW